MGKIVKSFAELEKVCQAKMRKAMEETINKSFQDLHTNVDHFSCLQSTLPLLPSCQ